MAEEKEEEKEGIEWGEIFGHLIRFMFCLEFINDTLGYMGKVRIDGLLRGLVLECSELWHFRGNKKSGR